MRHGVTRRYVISGLGAGAVGSLAGCTESALPEGDESASGDWPMSGHDATNTGVSPDAPGPDAPGERWRFALDRGLASSPAVAGRTAFVGTLGRRLHAIDVGDGDDRWTFETGEGAPAAPAVAGDAVYVAIEGSEVFAVGT